ncbi:MAG TPA: hypothetical protein PLD59_12685 [Tepidisphaeraceae bacterium]|nr:hypothetical protein [Tepidisphaeraceae bacterium]
MNVAILYCVLLLVLDCRGSEPMRGDHINACSMQMRGYGRPLQLGAVVFSGVVTSLSDQHVRAGNIETGNVHLKVDRILVGQPDDEVTLRYASWLGSLGVLTNYVRIWPDGGIQPGSRLLVVAIEGAENSIAGSGTEPCRYTATTVNTLTRPDDPNIKLAEDICRLHALAGTPEEIAALYTAARDDRFWVREYVGFRVVGELSQSQPHHAHEIVRRLISHSENRAKMEDNPQDQPRSQK